MRMGARIVFAGGAAVAAVVSVALFAKQRATAPALATCGATARARAALELPLRLEGYASRIDAAEARVADEVAAVVGRDHVHDVGVPRSYAEWSERRAMPRRPGEESDGLRAILVGYADRELLLPILRADVDPGAAQLDVLVAARVDALHRAALRRPYRFGVAGGAEVRDRIVATSPETPLERAGALLGGAAAFEVVDLDRSIDATLDGLFVTAPRSPFTDAQLAEVDRFVDAGKPTVVLASAAYENDAPSLASTRGLDGLLRRRGIEVRADELLAGKPTTFSPWVLRVAPERADDLAAPLVYGVDALYVGSASTLDVSRAREARVWLRAGRDALVREAGASRAHALAKDGTDGPPLVVSVGRLLVIGAHHALSNAFGTMHAADPAAEVARYARAMDPSTYAFLRNILEWMAVPEENWRTCTPTRHDPVHE